MVLADNDRAAGQLTRALGSVRLVHGYGQEGRSGGVSVAQEPSVGLNRLDGRCTAPPSPEVLQCVTPLLGAVLGGGFGPGGPVNGRTRHLRNGAIVNMSCPYQSGQLQAPPRAKGRLLALGPCLSPWPGPGYR